MLAGPLALLCGCGAALRAPLCQQGEFELPAGAQGRYRISMPQTDARYNNVVAGTEESEFEVVEQSDSYILSTTRAGGRSLRRVLARGGRSLVPTPLTTIGAGGPPPRTFMPLAVCHIGQSFYSQNVNEDGTYALSRFDLSPTGITLTALSFDPVELAKAGFGFVVAPPFPTVDDQHQWRFEGTSSRLIIDDRDVDATARERLLQLAHPTMMGIVFSRVDVSAARHERRSPPAFQVVLPKGR